MFSSEICEIFKNTYFEEHLRTSASLPVTLGNRNDFICFTVFSSVANNAQKMKFSIMDFLYFTVFLSVANNAQKMKFSIKDFFYFIVFLSAANNA